MNGHYHGTTSRSLSRRSTSNYSSSRGSGGDDGYDGGTCSDGSTAISITNSISIRRCWDFFVLCSFYFSSTVVMLRVKS